MTVARLEAEMPMDEFIHWMAKWKIDAEAMDRGRNPFPAGSQEAAVFELMSKKN